MITAITYPISNDDLGETSPADCDAYRAWFTEQLTTEYPGAAIDVPSRPGRVEINTDDEDYRDPQPDMDLLCEFAGRCWDRCPWAEITA